MSDDYNLEIDKVIAIIKKEKAKIILLQLPDGLKSKAMGIAEEIENNSKAKCLIWFGSCFGACDIPQVEKIKPKIDLIIQFGHTVWKFKRKDIKVIDR